MPKQTRLGADFQAEIPLLTSPSVRPPPAPPPLCLCARPATWLRKRWWCADEERGCAFEVVPPPFERTPLCSCAEVCRARLEPQPSRLEIDLPLTRASPALDSLRCGCHETSAGAAPPRAPRVAATSTSLVSTSRRTRRPRCSLT